MKGKSGRPEAGAGGPPPEDRAEERAGGRSPARTALVVVGSLVGAVVLLYAAAAILFQTLIDPATLSRWIEPRAEAALNRNVEIQGARLTIFPRPGAELHGLRVDNLPEYEGPPLAEIDRVGLRVAILPLLRRDIRVDDVRIRRPVIHLGVDAAGESNYGDLIPEGTGPDEEAEERPLELAVRDVRVEDARFSLRRVPDTVDVALAGLGAEASIERSAAGAWRIELSSRADSLRLGYPAVGPDPVRLAGPGLRTRVTAADEFERLEIEEGSLELGEAALDLTGRVERLNEPERRLDLRLRADDLDLERLVAMAPESAREDVAFRPTGSLAADLRVEGTVGPERAPEVTGTVELRSAGATGREGTVLADGIDGLLEIAGGEIAARELRGSVLDGPFALEGTLRADSTLAFRASVEAAPVLDRAVALAELPDGVELGGSVEARLRLEGELRNPAATAIDGDVDVRDVRIVHPELGVPATVPAAGVRFAGRSATWSDVVVELGEDRLRTTGTVEELLAVLDADPDVVPRVRGEVDGARLDLDRVVPPTGDPSITYGRIAFARLGDRPLEGRSAEEWAEEKELRLPDSLPAAGELEVRLDTLLSEPYRLTDVRATLRFGPAMIEVDGARFGLYGGRVATSFRLGVGGAPPEPFSFDLRAEGVRAPDFLAATSPLGPYVTGELDLELDATGRMDAALLPVREALDGSGRMEVREGGLRENPLTVALADRLGVPELAAPSYSRWSGPFRIEGGRVRFDDALFATELGDLHYGGLMGLDGGLDLVMEAEVPAVRLSSAMLERTGVGEDLLSRLEGAEVPVALGASIGGSIRDPRIEPRAALAGDAEQRLRERIEQEVRDTARARLEEVRDTAAQELEERARDFLRGLRSRDTARDTTPPDTLRREPRGPS